MLGVGLDDALRVSEAVGVSVDVDVWDGVCDWLLVVACVGLGVLVLLGVCVDVSVSRPAHVGVVWPVGPP